MMGLPKTSAPVNAAENTKRSNIAMGINTLLLTGEELSPRKYINEAITIT